MQQYQKRLRQTLDKYTDVNVGNVLAIIVVVTVIDGANC